jgi:hypothetical protein
MRFDMICEANGIKHRLTKPNQPWTNGQVERMNRTIKDANVKRFHCETRGQLRTHLADFLAAYNFARRLKTLGGLTPYEYICKIWTSEPDRFILDPVHQMPGLNRCLIPRFDGAILSREWKEALWDKFVTGAPRPRTPSEQQYSDRKLRSRS